MSGAETALIEILAGDDVSCLKSQSAVSGYLRGNYRSTFLCRGHCAGSGRKLRSLPSRGGIAPFAGQPCHGAGLVPDDQGSADDQAHAAGCHDGHIGDFVNNRLIEEQMFVTSLPGRKQVPQKMVMKIR